MRKITRISLALGTSAALLSLSALPASAADEDVLAAESNPTIEVKPGYLTIGVDPLGSNAEALAPGETAKFELPNVTVTDERAGITPWFATVEMSDFTKEGSTEVIKAADASYTMQDLRRVSGQVELSEANTEELTFLASEQAVQAVATDTVHGNNTVAWKATLTVAIPANAIADTYTATLTHSLIN